MMMVSTLVMVVMVPPYQRQARGQRCFLKEDDVFIRFDGKRSFHIYNHAIIYMYSNLGSLGMHATERDPIFAQ